LAQLDYIRPAIEDMQKYLDGTENASDLDEIRAQIIELEEQHRLH